MASKWKKILKGKRLPALPVEPEWRDKVNEEKLEYEDLKLDVLVRELNNFRDRKSAHEDKIDKLNVTIEALNQLVLDRMEEQNLDSVTVHGTVFYQHIEPYASMQDRALLFAYIKKTKQVSLLTVQWQTLNALVKELLIDGKPAPPGVKVFLKTTIGRREAQ